ncbi:MAG: site-specific DNA-methyltransferase, partial [Rhodospirillaceae bacterium]|nr:site-specific DNA-methyltransferase [Rhodospirillaceae bacterium]
MSANWRNRTLWTGDNLDIMRGMNSESVDLLYLDPPFNSNRDYAAPIGSEAAGAAFKDTWTLSDVDQAWHGEIADRAPALYAIIDAAGVAHGKGMKSYLIMMAVRLLEMKRLLKPTGSIYLHCDPTASHYLKMLMDSILGGGNFRNEVAWKRFNFHADAKRFGAITDRILFYAASDDCAFNPVRVPYSAEYIAAKFTHDDGDGRRYRLDNLNPPGDRGPVYEFHGVTKAWRMTEDKMRALDAEGRIYTKSKVPQLKRYLDEMPGQTVADFWADISPINPRAKERVGYPTQKPLALLDRIIRASSNPGDMVLDPFCGCATALV